MELGDPKVTDCFLLADRDSIAFQGDTGHHMEKQGRFANLLLFSSSYKATNIIMRPHLPS